MFSTIPSGDTPVSNSSVWLRPREAIRTSAENPGSATSASGTPVSGLTRLTARGSAPFKARASSRAHGVLVDEQRVGHVVHEHRDLDAVDRFERDRAHAFPGTQKRSPRSASSFASCSRWISRTRAGVIASSALTSSIARLVLSS